VFLAHQQQGYILSQKQMVFKITRFQPVVYMDNSINDTTTGARILIILLISASVKAQSPPQNGEHIEEMRFLSTDLPNNSTERQRTRDGYEMKDAVQIREPGDWLMPFSVYFS